MPKKRLPALIKTFIVLVLHVHQADPKGSVGICIRIHYCSTPYIFVLLNEDSKQILVFGSFTKSERLQIR